MRKFWNKDKKHQALMVTSAVVGVLAIAIIVIAVFIALRDKESNPVVLEVGGTSIHKDEYDNLVNQGQKFKIPASDVRSTLIDYYKNMVAAKKLDIEVSPKYPQLTRGQMVSQSLRDKQKKYDFEALSSSNDEIAKMMLYNAAFDVRVESINLGGYSIVVFDFPTVLNPYVDKNELMEGAKTDAEDFRKRIISGEVSGDKAIQEASRINSSAGRSSLSGYYFVSDNPAAIGGISGTGIQTFGFLGEHMKSVKNKGISEVSVTQEDDYFFVDYLHYDKADADISDKVASAKNQVRVVEYDK